MNDFKVTVLKEVIPPGAMITGEISKGVRVVHLPTGRAVECTLHRSQHKNKEDAIALLELMVGL